MAWAARLRRTWTALVAGAEQPLALDLTAATQVSVTSRCQLAPSNQLLPGYMHLVAAAQWLCYMPVVECHTSS